jgi:NADH:ubiquinone oxidoreductase subunit 2 (subunit N)
MMPFNVVAITPVYLLTMLMCFYMSGIPQGSLKMIQEYPIIIALAFIISCVLGINSLIYSNDLISIFLSIELQSWAVFILAVFILVNPFLFIMNDSNLCYYPFLLFTRF